MIKKALQTFSFLVYLFLYVPIFVLAIHSFNDNAFTYDWKGFTLEWYKNLFDSTEVWEALVNSIFVAITVVILSLLLSTFFVVFSKFELPEKMQYFFYAGLAVPEIVLATGILIFFLLLNVPLSFTALIISHTIIGLGYSIPIIYARYKSLDVYVIEASYDLGANHVQTFFRVVFPFLFSSIVASGLLVFIFSFDDFDLPFFCTGAEGDTLPIFIYSMIQSGATPEVNALSVLLLLITFSSVLGLFILNYSNAGQE